MIGSIGGKFRIFYYLKGRRHAIRNCEYIPRKGEEIRLADGLYKIGLIVYIEDDENPHIAIDITPVVRMSTGTEKKKNGKKI